MENHQLKKFDHNNIANIIAELELPEAILDTILPMQTDVQILNALLASNCKFAISFLALGLPKREAVWWSHLCTQEAERETTDLPTQHILRLVHDWVHDPEDEKRQQAKKYADLLQHSTPASWSAMAVFWSGGSVAPPGQPDLEPEPFMCGHAVANAVNLSAEKIDDADKNSKLFLKKGLHIAMGGNGKIE